MQPQVMIVVGSDSDLPVIKPACQFLEEMAIGYTIHISSAHRVPEKTGKLAAEACDKGYEVIIAAAGGAAHLPGVIAAQTCLPVIGVPVKSEALNGVDSLYSIVQMPSGIPVATVGINAAKNAAILAVQILGVKSAAIRQQINVFKKDLAQQVQSKDELLQEVGIHHYQKK